MPARPAPIRVTVRAPLPSLVAAIVTERKATICIESGTHPTGFASSSVRGAISPDSGVRAIADYVAGQITTPGFRGCAFLNAAAEYPISEDPIHQAILARRNWFYETG